MLRLVIILIHVSVRLADVGNVNAMKEKEEEFDISFLDPEQLKQSQDKLKNGEITCNIDSPEDCESCSG